MNGSKPTPMYPAQIVAEERFTKVCHLVGGSFHGLRVLSPIIGSKLLINHFDKNTGDTFISEYRLNGIHEIFVWEYRYAGTLPADEVDYEYYIDDDEPGF